MKKILIIIFLSCSMFIMINAFVSKASGKEPFRVKSVLNELKQADIGFEINKDIKELSQSLNDLNLNSGIAGNDIFSTLSDIGKSIYYFGRFAIKMVIHTLVAAINVIILTLRVVGISNLNYFHLSEPKSGFPWPVNDPNGMITPLPTTPWS